MNNTVWKYQLIVADEQNVKLPAGARPLSVGLQHGTLCMWAAVDPAAPKRLAKIRVRGTGHPLDGARVEDFLGTFQALGGQLVFHVFIDPPESWA